MPPQSMIWLDVFCGVQHPMADRGDHKAFAIRGFVKVSPLFAVGRRLVDKVVSETLAHHRTGLGPELFHPSRGSHELKAFPANDGPNLQLRRDAGQLNGEFALVYPTDDLVQSQPHGLGRLP